jgi:hypothetical protein
MTNRNLLILGSTALLVLGALGFFLASLKHGDARTNISNFNNEIINNSYFQQLIASGETTERDLDAVTDIRPLEDGFVGVSKESRAWESAQALAKLVGAEVLEIGNGIKQEETTRWLASTFANVYESPAWVQEDGQPKVFDGGNVLPAPSKESVRRVVLRWSLQKGVRWVVESLPHPDQDGWIPIFDGTRLFGCDPDHPRFKSGKIRIEDNCLRLENNTGFDVGFVARDAVIRARFKMVIAPPVAPVMLGISNVPGHKYLSYFSGRRSYKRLSHGAGVYFFGIGWLDPGYKDLAGNLLSIDLDNVIDDKLKQSGGFIEMEMRAIGQEIIVRAFEHEVCRVNTPERANIGLVSVGSNRSVGLFQRIEIKALNDERP